MSDMDDEAALRARRVAMAASAWLNAPADTHAYERLVDAVGEWNAYRDPHLERAPETDEVDLLDEAADVDLPPTLGEVLPELESALRAQARRNVSPVTPPAGG